MRKFIYYIILLPALALLAISLTLMAIALSVVGGAKGVSVLTRAIRAFAANLEI
ncbi:hypothetical protein [Klebsiella phage Kp2]|uniref:Uncharacterized protein n=1 Tax=Klebsiella phage Kp2 TaxID=1701805 RepID=A0A0P0IXS6_9CAUD|nr:hypothetical protein AU150_gp29 [Klebsiella phage Kp2]ALJ98126.1 hypothetical protein [Klebsiella phage Kp2]